MIELSGVWQHYGIRPVLRGVDLKIERGELIALMGPNGMGKSTLMRVMAGVLIPQKGWAAIDGVHRRASVEEELAIRSKVVYLPDDPWLPAMHSGREFLLAVGRLYDVEDYHLFDHVDRLLELFHLEDKGDAPVSSYSHGQKKKIALCSALVTEAPVMLLDEPFSGGLDPSALLALKQVLKKLAEGDERTIVLATQVPELVEDLADRIIVLKDGGILAIGNMQTLRERAGIEGDLDEVLEKLTNPHTIDRIERYLGKG